MGSPGDPRKKGQLDLLRCFVLCTWGRASFLTKCPSCVEVRGRRSRRVAFLVALERTNGCLVHVDFEHPLAIWDSAAIPPLPRTKNLRRLSENRDRLTHPNEIVATKNKPDSGVGKRPRFWCQKTTPVSGSVHIILRFLFKHEPTPNLVTFSDTRIGVVF